MVLHTLEPWLGCSNDLGENDIVRRRILSEDRRWVYKYVFLDTYCSIKDSFCSRVLNASGQLLLDEVLPNGDLINECSSQQLAKDLQLQDNV